MHVSCEERDIKSINQVLQLSEGRDLFGQADGGVGTVHTQRL